MLFPVLPILFSYFFFFFSDCFPFSQGISRHYSCVFPSQWYLRVSQVSTHPGCSLKGAAGIFKGVSVSKAWLPGSQLPVFLLVLSADIFFFILVLILSFFSGHSAHMLTSVFFVVSNYIELYALPCYGAPPSISALLLIFPRIFQDIFLEELPHQLWAEPWRLHWDCLELAAMDPRQPRFLLTMPCPAQRHLHTYIYKCVCVYTYLCAYIPSALVHQLLITETARETEHKDLIQCAYNRKTQCKENYQCVSLRETLFKCCNVVFPWDWVSKENMFLTDTQTHIYTKVKSSSLLKISLNNFDTHTPIPMRTAFVC